MSLSCTTSKPARRVVGIGEMIVSSATEDSLITFSLGSCLGISVYEPQVKVGGLIHCMLPCSSIDTGRQRFNPYRYIDSGLIALLEAVLELGGEPSRFRIKVGGAAAPLDACGRFKIGEKNLDMLCRILDKNGLPLAASDVGGTAPRTMSLHIGSGRTSIRKMGKEAEL